MQILSATKSRVLAENEQQKSKFYLYFWRFTAATNDYNLIRGNLLEFFKEGLNNFLVRRKHFDSATVNCSLKVLARVFTRKSTKTSFRTLY